LHRAFYAKDLYGEQTVAHNGEISPLSIFFVIAFIASSIGSSFLAIFSPGIATYFRTYKRDEVFHI
jgi:hypothetical protein